MKFRLVHWTLHILFVKYKRYWGMRCQYEYCKIDKHILFLIMEIIVTHVLGTIYMFPVLRKKINS